MVLISCSQTRCAYHPANNKELTLPNGMRISTQDLCPECEECNAESHIINDECCNCWNCLKDEGFVRQGTPDLLKKKVIMPCKIPN